MFRGQVGPVFFFLGVKKKVGVKKHFFASLFCFFSRAKSIFHARIFRIFRVFSRGNLLEKLQIHDFFRVLPVKIKQFCTGKSSHLRILEFFHGCENAFHAQKKKTLWVHTKVWVTPFYVFLCFLFLSFFLSFSFSCSFSFSFSISFSFTLPRLEEAWMPPKGPF